MTKESRRKTTIVCTSVFMYTVKEYDPSRTRSIKEYNSVMNIFIDCEGTVSTCQHTFNGQRAVPNGANSTPGVWLGRFDSARTKTFVHHSNKRFSMGSDMRGHAINGG